MIPAWIADMQMEDGASYGNEPHTRGASSALSSDSMSGKQPPGQGIAKMPNAPGTASRSLNVNRHQSSEERGGCDCDCALPVMANDRLTVTVRAIHTRTATAATTDRV